MENGEQNSISKQLKEQRNYNQFFPYEPRESQKYLIDEILSSIRQKKQCCVEAPCGTGKTIAILTALLDDFSEGYIFWLGNTGSIYENVTKDILAINKFLEKQNLRQYQLLLATFIGKKKMCLHSDAKKSANFYEECRDLRDSRLCEYYNQVFDEKPEDEETEDTQSERKEELILSIEAEWLLNQVIPDFKKGKISTELLTEKEWSWADYIIDKCTEIPQMCPFEIMSLIGRNATIISWDYNYIFLSGPRKAMFQKLKISTNSMMRIVIDEADIFYDRMVSFLTRNLTNYSLDLLDSRIRSLFEKGYIPEYAFNSYIKYIKQLTTLLTDFAFNCTTSNKTEKIITKDDLIQYFNSQSESFRFNNITKELKLIIENTKVEDQEELNRIDLFFEHWEVADSHNYVRIVQRKKEVNLKKFEIKICPLNLDKVPFYYDKNDKTQPIYFRKILDFYSTCTFTSATLFPRFFIKRLGLNPLTTDVISINSYHIPKSQYQILIPSYLSSKQKERPIMYPRMANLLVKLLLETKEKILVFSVSKESTDDIYFHVQKMVNLKSYSDRIYWSHLRSIDSRGVDRRDYRIVLIAGYAYPPIHDKFIKAQEKYLINTFGKKKGKEIFVSDIIKATIQAMSRPLRKDKDSALIILADDRFLWNSNKQLFPAYFHDRMKRVNTEKELMSSTIKFLKTVNYEKKM